MIGILAIAGVVILAVLICALTSGTHSINVLGFWCDID